MAGDPLNYYFVPFPQEIWDTQLRLTLGEFRLLGYLLRHKVGCGNAGRRISDDELFNGIRNANGSRRDGGCGLGGLNVIKDARERLRKRGWLDVYEDRTVPSSIHRSYALRVPFFNAPEREKSDAVPAPVPVTTRPRRKGPRLVTGTRDRDVARSKSDGESPELRGEQLEAGCSGQLFRGSELDPRGLAVIVEQSELDRSELDPGGPELIAEQPNSDSNCPERIVEQPDLDRLELGPRDLNQVTEQPDLGPLSKEYRSSKEVREGTPSRLSLEVKSVSTLAAVSPRSGAVTRAPDRSERAVDPRAVLFREIRRELFPYFGFAPETQYVEQVLRSVEGTRERGFPVGGAEVRESVKRALAWWRANRGSAHPSGLFCFNRAWAELLAERVTEAPEPRNPDLGTVPCETTRRELARLEKRWGAAILAQDTGAQEVCSREVSAVYERLKWRGDPLRACCSASRDGARDWAQRLQRQQSVGSGQ